MNSSDIKSLILDKHVLPEWATFTELRSSTGFVNNARTIDVATFNTYPSKAKRIAYEIKIHRSDFIKELEEPGKRAWCEEIFHETYFVCTSNVCKPEEVPEGWGLYYVTKNGKSLRRKVIAKYRDVANDLPYSITMSIFRRMCDDLQHEKSRLRFVDGESYTSDELKKYIDEVYFQTAEEFRTGKERLDKEIEKTHEIRKKLIKPFSTLYKIMCDKYGYLKEDEITPENVEKWCNNTKSEIFRYVKYDLVKMKEAIDSLLNNMED